MRHTFQTMTIVLLAGAMLAGCDYSFMPYRIPEVAAVEPPPPERSRDYIDDLLKADSTVDEGTTAVDIGADALVKLKEAIDELKELQDKNTALLQKERDSQVQLVKLQSELTRSEKELGEANTLLKEMQDELKQWKQDVLGFRKEMRDSQRALLMGVTRLHVLISGGVAVEDPPKKTQSAPIATNIKEKSGDAIR